VEEDEEDEVQEDDDEDVEEDQEMKKLKDLSGNHIPQSGLHELTLRAMYMNMHRSEFEPSEAVWQAIANMRQNDLRLKMSASYIQRKWQDNSAKLQKRDVSRLQWCVESRNVKAPAYFGESSLWLPFDEWDVVPVHHTYGARCVQYCELLLIPREKLQQLIHDYSPWLRQRFEAFRADVVAARASALPQQPKADVLKPACQGNGKGKCFGDSMAVGAVGAGTLTVGGGPSSLARTDGSADAECLARRRSASNPVVRDCMPMQQSLQTCMPALSLSGDAVIQAHGGYESNLRTPLLGE